MSTVQAQPWGPDTIPLGLDAEPVERRPAATRPLEIRFTGSGSEYFRIWIVNLLLSIVTLSLYRPWAKVRRLRYFYANTLIDGHALDFHGNPKKMLRGYLLVGAMVLCYSLASRFSPVAGVVAFLAVALLWPALLRASMQFKLANTSWRGLRFRFSGNVADAYRALLPLFLPGLAFVLVGLAMPDRQHPPAWAGAAFLAVTLFTFALLPLAWLNLKRYQHDHYGIGQWQSRLDLGAGRVYALCAKGFGLMLLSGLAVALLAAVIGGVLGFALRGEAPTHRGPGVIIAISTAITMGVWLLLLLVPMPYLLSRFQNLLWNHTASPAVRFSGRLRMRPLLGLTVKNWLLMLLTLGLYWPFAAVAMYRLRVEAVTPELRGDLDDLHQRLRPAGDDATGDAAGDLFGFDIGL